MSGDAVSAAAEGVGGFLHRMASSPFDKQEAEIRRYWRDDRPFDTLQDGFDRLSALAMLAEIDRLRERIGDLDPAAGTEWEREV